MACKPALEARLRTRLSLDATAPVPELKSLPEDDPLWDLVVHYMAGLCVSIILLVSPERIALGGGLMQNLSLFPRIRLRVQEVLNCYINVNTITDATLMEAYIVPPVNGADAGLIGACQIAETAREDAQRARDLPRGGTSWRYAAAIGFALAGIAGVSYWREKKRG